MQGQAVGVANLMTSQARYDDRTVDVAQRDYELMRMAQMALYRYYRPADGVLDPNCPLACMIASNVPSEVNKEMNQH